MRYVHHAHTAVPFFRAVTLSVMLCGMLLTACGGGEDTKWDGTASPAIADAATATADTVTAPAEEAATADAATATAQIMATPSAATPLVPTPENPVCFYQWVGYQGQSFCVPEGAAEVSDFWNNRISAVRVLAGSQVTVWLEHNFTGRSQTLTGDNSSLPGIGFDNAISSFKVSKQQAPASNPLPFDMEAAGVLRGGSKKVFAHYMPGHPISLKNQPPESDWWSLNYVAPNGDNGKHVAYGGFWRAQPLLQAPITGADDLLTLADGTTKVARWRLLNMKTEVRRALAAGMDGFTVEMLHVERGIDTRLWDNVFLLLEAARDVNIEIGETGLNNGFKMMLMPDMAGPLGKGPDPDFVVANKMVRFVALLAQKYPQTAYHLPDGRLVLSPFVAEARPATWWKYVLAKLKSDHGIDVAFVPCFLSYKANVEAFASMSYGLSHWGDRDAGTNAGIATKIADAHARKKIWMQPVALQDVRPRSGMYSEANNTENLRVSWAGASGAEWVHLITWNDYAEGSQIAPSTQIGWAALDLMTYYTVAFKTGAPQIKRDVLYLSHRIQPFAALPTDQGVGNPKVPSLMKLYTAPPRHSKPRDKVELLSMLTQAAQVRVVIGSVVHTYTAPAGVHVETFDLALGTVSATASRGATTVASVVSPSPVVARPPIQDLLYHFAVSSR